MHRQRLLTGALLLVVGCAARFPDAGFHDVQNAVAARGGQAIQWRGMTAEDAAIDAAVRDLLAGELTVDRAVQVALLSNHSLQATFEELGVARADLVQAGLLANPVFDASVRFPDRSPRGPNVELSITQQFIDLLLLPARKKLAAAQFQQAKLRVTAEVMSFSADVKSAYVNLAAAGQLLEMRRTVLDAAAASAEMARRMNQAGTLNDLDQAGEQAMYEQAKLDLAAAGAQQREFRQKLGALMGVGDEQVHWRIAAHLADLAGEESPPERLEARALDQRADLAAARQAVVVAGAALGVTEKSRLFSELRIGADTERDPGGQRVTGPIISLPIPLLDTGAAAVARRRALLRQAQQQYAAILVQVRSEVRRARDRMIAAQTRAEAYRKVVLPLRHRITQQMQLHYNGMLAGVFQLLAAKQSEITAGREYIESLRDYWLARIELERAVGGALASAPTTQPATAPATEPAVPLHEHHH